MCSSEAARSMASEIAIPKEPVVSGFSAKILRPISVSFEGEGF